MAFYNDSKFHMWRGCIAAVWIDGILADEERDWVLTKIETLRFTDEQKKVLLVDLNQRANFSEIVSKITDKKDKAFLAYQIRVIAQLDKDYSDSEKKLYETWNEIVLNGLDLDYLEQIIAADEKASYHEDEVYKVNNQHSIFERTIKSAQRVLNKGDYVFPKDDSKD